VGYCRRLAQTCRAGCNLCQKGTLVLVSGRLSIRKYTDKTSVERTAVEIIACDVRFLEPKEKQPEEEPLEPEQAA